MERSAAIPLEDALSAIPGVYSVYSSSENSMARISVRFGRGNRGQYEAVREAAQKVYEAMPPSAQRPEIQSSDDSRIPVWSAAVSGGAEHSADTALYLERIIKPRLESLEGVGEALISGTGLQEIIVALYPEKAAALGLNPSAVAAALAANDALFSGGTLEYLGREITITVDGRADSAADSGYSTAPAAAVLGEVLVPLGEGRSIALSEIAEVYEQERSPDTLARLNGKKAAVISVMGSSGADLRKLSRDIHRELASRPFPFEFTVLSDRGAEEAAAFRSVFGAALQGAFLVALAAFLLNRGKSRAAFFCAVSIPAVCLVSAALLAALGFSPDRSVLAGIAAGAGAAADAVILCSEKLKSCRNYSEARSALGRIRGPLIAGSATTVAALLPLPAMGFGELGVIACAIAAVTVTALLLSICLLPPLLLWDSKAPPPRVKTHAYVSGRYVRRIIRVLRRFLAADVRLCARYPLRIVIAAAAVSAAGIVALLIRGVDTGAYGSGDSVYAQVEFDGGLLAEETDRLLAAYGEDMASRSGINNVETGARTGSGSVLISFDPKRISAEKVRELARSSAIPGGFLFFPETSATERYWEIKIAGDDEARCREIAEELAHSAAAWPLVKERVLNFKQGSKRLDLLPDRERLAGSGITLSLAADTARRGIHGPVAYKRIGLRGETDVRVRTGGPSPYRSAALGIPVFSESGGGHPRMDTLMRLREGYEPASIRREDRRRTASITISTKSMDPRRVQKALAGLLQKPDLPPGYVIEFDPAAIRQAELLSQSSLFFLLALVFCYMVIAAVNESFLLPLAVLSAIPPSLAIPALCLAAAGRPFNPAAACAFVAVSGMTVNAAVLCAGAFLESKNTGASMGLYRALRQNMPALLATTATTVAGALPFLFLGEGANTPARTLSLVMALGVGSSCFWAISAVPALLILIGHIGMGKNFRLSGRGFIIEGYTK
jgi:multidrug efflux pump subunit AcrB